MISLSAEHHYQYNKKFGHREMNLKRDLTRLLVIALCFYYPVEIKLGLMILFMQAMKDGDLLN